VTDKAVSKQKSKLQKKGLAVKTGFFSPHKLILDEKQEEHSSDLQSNTSDYLHYWGFLFLILTGNYVSVDTDGGAGDSDRRAGEQRRYVAEGAGGGGHGGHPPLLAITHPAKLPPG
jgi:hypothetical protein